MSLARATLLLLGLTFLSRLLGVVREIVIAWRFGASAETDAFFVAFSLPYAFYTVVGMSLTAVIVPLLADYEANGKHDEAMRVASLVINVSLLSIGALALIGTLGASEVAWLLGGGFDAATLSRATNFTAIMMPSIIFMGIAGIFAGILNHRHIFAPPALGPIAMNVTIILGAFIGGIWGETYGLVLGTVVGALLFLVVQLPALHRIGYVHRWTFSISDPIVRRVGGLIWPVMLVSVLGFLYTAIDFRLASAMDEGSVTALNYAFKLMQLPQALFVVAVTTAIFPTLSKLAAEERKREMATLLQMALRLILLLAIPGTVGLIIIGEPLVQLLLQHGAFDATATERTGSALFYLSVGLVGFCLNLPLIRGFYALNDRRTPLVLGLASIGVKFMLSLVFAESLQHNGLALSSSVTILLNAAALAMMLRLKLAALLDVDFIAFVFNVSVASAVMGVAIVAIDDHLSAWQEGTLMVAARLLAVALSGSVIFVASAWLFGVEEVKRAMRRLVESLGPLLAR